ncbi:MAG: glycosyltransferase [Candidatus Micrarchaeota archaeon]|nr:glycosyltransferase [Candidatus Micrarchaeota archaeon]
MEVALFTDSYLPLRDGVVSSILNLRKGLGRKGWKMHIFAPSLPHQKPERRVYRYPSVSFPPYPDYHAALLPARHPPEALRARVALVHSKAMVNMGLAALSYAKRKNLPAMASLETLIPDGVHYVLPIKELHRLGKAVGWAYLRWFYSKFDLVSAPSRHAQALMAENGIEAVLLPSPVDTSRFKPTGRGGKIRKELGLEGKKIVLSVGRLVREKNYSLLLSAAKHMRDERVVFLAVGRGPYLDAFKKEVQRAGLSGSFHFAGFVPDNILADYYNAADCFVFPSSFETQGLSALEALSCGKPVCALDDTPMSEFIIEGRNGYVFSDAEECAEKLSACLENAGRMAACARRTALAYSIPRCTSLLLRCYRTLLQ